MPDSQINIKKIRTSVIKGIGYGYLPLVIYSWIEPFFKSHPQYEIILDSISLVFLIFFISGYILSAKAINKYAQYKGYKNYFYIYSILNIFGLSILFLLKNRNISKNSNFNKEPLLNFSIFSIFISLFAITVALIPFLYLIAFFIVGTEGFEEYISKNEIFLAVSNISIEIIFIWYLIGELKRADVNYKFILGSLKKIDFKLPIGLAIIEIFFAKGINSISLYSLSFVVPQYIENEINREYATTPLGWICFSISALFFAPLMEEFLFRGVIFQKLALQKNIIKGLIISAIAFALMHFRYDVIYLFIMGIILGLLYLKTKQLAVPIICHFFYNLIVVAANIYNQFFLGIEPSLKITVAEYQQNFLDKWELNILFLAISTPYLAYFIYKNFPRNYKLEKLPYFANQLDGSN